MIPNGCTVRSRKGSLADKAVKLLKRKAEEKRRDHVKVDGKKIDNVYYFEYLGSRMSCDGDDMADVKHRMSIAQSSFNSLSHIWKDHRLPQSMKLKLYQTSVCSSFTHACEAWDLTDKVRKCINALNSRCLYVITKKDYRETATNPDLDLLLLIHRRRMRYLGHILRMDKNRLVRQTLAAYVHGGKRVPEGSLLDDCVIKDFDKLAVIARNRKEWRKMVYSLQ